MFLGINLGFEGVTFDFWNKIAKNPKLFKPKSTCYDSSKYPKTGASLRSDYTNY